MEELFSKSQDCKELAKKLNKELKDKIMFYGSINQEVITGKYMCFPYHMYDNFTDYEKDLVSFYYKYCKDGFLRIGISNNICKKSMGHKLAVLSDFYEILSEEFGEPTLFYTTKGDEAETINLNWSFRNKNADITKFKNDTMFDDANIDELIIFGEQNVQINEYPLSDITKKITSRKIGLPFEMIHLLDSNIEDFIKYKHKLEIDHSIDSKIDILHLSKIGKIRSEFENNIESEKNKEKVKHLVKENI